MLAELQQKCFGRGFGFHPEKEGKLLFKEYVYIATKFISLNLPLYRL